MNKAQFLLMIEQIDEELRKNEIAIQARPIHAIRLLAIRLKTDIFCAYNSQKSIVGKYNKFTLSKHIDNWYKSQYGDRININPSPGSVVLFFRNDPWRIVLPGILGSVEMVCDPNLEKYKNTPKIGNRKNLPVCNILNCIDDFPKGLASTLKNQELHEIVLFFKSCWKIFDSLEKVKDKPFVKEALADLDNAVANIFFRPPQYGLSKWSSLQLIEKLLKSFLKLKGAKIPKHHNLKIIAEKAESKNIAKIDRSLISKIQCSAGVRYGEEKVDLKDAIDAHHTSLKLSKKIANEISHI